MNKTEQHEYYARMESNMIDHFDILCEMIQHAKFNLDGKRKEMIYYSIIGLEQISDQIEHLEKLKERK